MKLLNGIAKHFHLFKWKKCYICNDSFVRESGWKLTNLPFLPRKEIFICRDCISKVKDINEYVTNRTYIPKKKYAKNTHEIKPNMYSHRRRN